MLQKYKSGYVIIDPTNGKWKFDLRSLKDIDFPTGSIIHSVEDIRDYNGWQYNVNTSISVAIKDIENGRWDQSEVGR